MSETQWKPPIWTVPSLSSGETAKIPKGLTATIIIIIIITIVIGLIRCFWCTLWRKYSATYICTTASPAFSSVSVWTEDFFEFDFGSKSVSSPCGRGLKQKARETSKTNERQTSGKYKSRNWWELNPERKHGEEPWQEELDQGEAGNFNDGLTEEHLERHVYNQDSLHWLIQLERAGKNTKYFGIGAIWGLIFCGYDGDEWWST